MRRRDPVTAPPRKNVFMNASALFGPSKGGLPRPSEDEGILSTLASGGSLLSPFEEEPTAPPEYPDVEKAIEESMESFHRVIAASCTLCMPEVAPRSIKQSEHLIEVFVFHCFDNENKTLGQVKIAANLSWVLAREKISQVTGEASVFSYLNSSTNEVIVVRSEEEWKECCQFVIEANLQKSLEIVIISLQELAMKEPPPEIGFIDGAPIEGEVPVKQEQHPPHTPPRFEPDRPPSPTPTPPPAQRDVTPQEPALEEEFPPGSYVMDKGDYGTFFDLLTVIENKQMLSKEQNETLVDLVTSGDVHCERAFQRFKKTGDLHKMCSDLVERL